MFVTCSVFVADPRNWTTLEAFREWELLCDRNKPVILKESPAFQMQQVGTYMAAAAFREIADLRLQVAALITQLDKVNRGNG